MKCTKCNYESLNLNAKFCKKCGSKLVREKHFAVIVEIKYHIKVIFAVIVAKK